MVSRISYYIFFLKYFLKRFYLFIQRRREGQRERNINVWLSFECPLLGTWPTTQACALTGNPTGHPLVHRPALNPLSHTSQGYFYILPFPFLLYIIQGLFTSYKISWLIFYFSAYIVLPCLVFPKHSFLINYLLWFFIY